MTAVRKPAVETYTIQLRPEVAAGLRRTSEQTGETVEALIVSAALAYADGVAEAPTRWTDEDVAAIDEGFTQIDRGESHSQEEVEAQIDAALR